MKNKYVASLLAFLFGGIGFHKFYLGRNGQGIFYIIFCLTFIPLIISIIEGFIYLFTSEKEFNIKYNSDYLRNKQLWNQKQ